MNTTSPVCAKCEHSFRVVSRSGAGSLPRPGQEHGAHRDAVRAVEPVNGASAVDRDHGSGPCENSMRNEQGENALKGASPDRASRK